MELPALLGGLDVLLAALSRLVCRLALSIDRLFGSGMKPSSPSSTISYGLMLASLTVALYL